MRRIVILGNTAGGKSTLARALAQATGIPHVEIDRIYWQPDWTVTPKEDYQRHHAGIIAQEAWIIDGGGDLESIEARLERATEIVLVDLPLWVHFWLAAERQNAWKSGTLENPPAGNTEVPPTGRLFEIIWTVDREWMPTLRKLCDERQSLGTEVLRITSLDQLNAFIAIR